MNCVINAKFLGQSITGTQQVGIGLSRYLKREIEDSYFVTTKKVIHQEMAEELEAISVGEKNNSLWEQYELPIFLRKHNNPLLIDFGNTAPIFYKNKIATILDISPNLYPEWYSLKHRYYLQMLSNLYIKNSRKILTISNFCKEQIVDYYKVSPDFVDVIYCSCPADIENSKDEQYTNPYGKYILGVSQIHPRKNFKSLVKAFKQSNLTDTKLILVGNQSTVGGDKSLLSEIPNNGSVIFTGYISNTELVNLYKHALFFIYPSYYEGFGIPPLEAMVHGCPTIVSNTSSLPEVCGDASLYIDPYNLETIVDSIIELSKNAALRKSLIENGYKRVKLFSWERSAKKLTNVIKDYL